MMRRTLLVGWFAVALAITASGCCVDACGVRRGPLGRPLPGAIDCECGGSGCGTCARGGLLQNLNYRRSCGVGCGEIYADEWASDPPDCCEPCEGMGRMGGCGSCGGCGSGGCGGRRGGGPLFPFSGMGNLWGRRYSPERTYGYSDYDDMGYEDDGEVIYEGGTMPEGEVVPQGSTPKAVPQTPTPAARHPHSALKKSVSQPQFYEPAQPRPASRSRMPGFRTASNPYPARSY